MNYWLTAGLLGLSGCIGAEPFTAFNISESSFFSKSHLDVPPDVSHIHVVATADEYLIIGWSFGSELGNELGIGVVVGERGGDGAVKVGDSICLETSDAFDCTDEVSGLGIMFPYTTGQNGNHIGRIHRFGEE